MEDDESTIVCCKQLASSYDFASSICMHLINYLNAAAETTTTTTTKVNSQETMKRESQLLNESDFNLAFDVMNKLTWNNELFCISIHVKQLIYILIENIM